MRRVTSVFYALLLIVCLCACAAKPALKAHYVQKYPRPHTLVETREDFSKIGDRKY